MEITKATRKNIFGKLMLYGISGSGKTPLALQLATALARSIGKRVLTADLEAGKSMLYAPAEGEEPSFEKGTWDFDHINVVDHRNEAIMECIRIAVKNGYGAIVIDSMSEAWEELTHRRERIAESTKISTWAAGAKTAEVQKKMMEYILNAPIHVICIVRAKNEWVVGEDKKPKKVGMAPIQKDTFEFDFDVRIYLNDNMTFSIERWRNNMSMAGKQFNTMTEAVPFSKYLSDWFTGKRSEAPNQQPTINSPKQ